jgi:hypothetical protein
MSGLKKSHCKRGGTPEDVANVCIFLGSTYRHMLVVRLLMSAVL